MNYNNAIVAILVIVAICYLAGLPREEVNAAGFITEYEVAQGGTIDELKEEVARLIEDDFYPVGGILYNLDDGVYCQAMVRKRTGLRD